MAAKRRCPDCGAKNELSVRRCRLCTALINPDAPEADADGSLDETASGPGPIGNFDADQINRQVQPARSRFGAGSSGLSARIAAAKGEPAPPVPQEASDLIAPPTASTAPPLEYEAEPFDPEDLFR